jgi:hypothetical protein
MLSHAAVAAVGRRGRSVRTPSGLPRAAHRITLRGRLIPVTADLADELGILREVRGGDGVPG